VLHMWPTRMHGPTGFPRTLIITTCSYLSALFSTLNPILSVTNPSRLECAETQSRASVRGNPLHPSRPHMDNGALDILRYI